MRRADRLFQIVQHLRARKLTTAAQLGEWLEVSERTIYRDIRDLSRSGVPIEGEAGVGYRIRREFEVPPLMFTVDEVEALVAGARMVQSWGGPALSKASRSALEKLTMALPAARRNEVERTPLYAPAFHVDPAVGVTLESIRFAITQKQKIQLDYESAKLDRSLRLVRPLGLHFWGDRWTVAAWCETRADFRNFRLDRCRAVTVTTENFRDEAGKTLADFIASMSTR